MTLIYFHLDFPYNEPNVCFSEPFGGRLRNSIYPLIPRVPCFPLYSILLALGNPTVDYFSLDVEGAEWLIVETLPWSKVDISIFNYEHAHLGTDNVLLHSFMKESGYQLNQTVHWDTIFIKNGFSP